MLEKEYSVQISRLAEKDLDGIFDYYLDVSKEILVAEKICNKLLSAISKLAFSPYIHPIAQEARANRAGVRKLFCEKYIIPFYIDETNKIISVSRIFHERMNYQQYL